MLFSGFFSLDSPFLPAPWMMRSSQYSPFPDLTHIHSAIHCSADLSARVKRGPTVSRQVSRFSLISLRIVATNNFFYFFVERCNENIKEKRLCRVSRRTFIFSSLRDISWIFFFASLVLEIREIRFGRIFEKQKNQKGR